MSSRIDFNNRSVAGSYDDLLVPLLFEPWARELVSGFAPWDGLRVLDLATGTGAVAQQLAAAVGAQGQVVGADLNRSMLALAGTRCAPLAPTAGFVQTSAHPLALGPQNFDVVVCQQGFQFFPDAAAAAAEMFRVLRPGGRLVVSVWRPLDECPFFDCLCTTLDEIGVPELATLMRQPFEFMSEDAFGALFVAAGFQQVHIARERRPLQIPHGMAQALALTYATPVGPQLAALAAATREAFERRFSERLRPLLGAAASAGDMATSVLSATRPA